MSTYLKTFIFIFCFLLVRGEPFPARYSYTYFKIFIASFNMSIYLSALNGLLYGKEFKKKKRKRAGKTFFPDTAGSNRTGHFGG